MQWLLSNIYSFSNLTNLTSYIYITAILDIAIVASLMYTAILLFKRAHSYFILLGIALMGLLYGVALVFNLYLTTIALQAFFAAILIVIVVLFQEELRRFFEYLAHVGTRLQRAEGPSLKRVEIAEIVRAVLTLAQRKTGALLVFPGSEGIERHVRAGRLLDAVISEELLLSLFDSATPGHDGAAIIAKGRLVRFGVQLPLSDSGGGKKRGMRHAAARGLAERTNALVVVVSEERGSVSVARGGALRELPEPEKLSGVLEKFLAKGTVSKQRWFTRMFSNNPKEKLIATVASAMLWALVAFPAETVQRDFVLPITFENLPETITIVGTEPKEVTVALAGRGRTSFENVDPLSLAIVVDGKALVDGINQIPIQERMVIRPKNVSVINLNPNSITVVTEGVRFLDVPIEVRTSGDVADGFLLDDVSVSPKHVTLIVPTDAKAPERIETEFVSIAGLSENETTTAALILPLQTRFEDENQAKVTVLISVGEKEGQ